MGEEVPPVPAEVVKLTDFIQRKLNAIKECKHDRLEVDAQNRRVECRDCKREVDPFEAMMIVADDASSYQLTYEQMKKDHRNLADYVPHLRAVRDLESMWRGKRLPMCPHCKKGVSAEAMSRMGWVHQAYAAAVEDHERETKVAAEVVVLPDAP